MLAGWRVFTCSLLWQAGPHFLQDMVQRLSAMGQMPGQRPRRCDFEHQFLKVVLPLG